LVGKPPKCQKNLEPSGLKGWQNRLRFEQPFKSIEHICRDIVRVQFVAFPKNLRANLVEESVEVSGCSVWFLQEHSSECADQIRLCDDSGFIDGHSFTHGAKRTLAE
jgi:hypothetical protein